MGWGASPSRGSSGEGKAMAECGHSPALPQPWLYLVVSYTRHSPGCHPCPCHLPLVDDWVDNHGFPWSGLRLAHWRK